MKFQKAVSTARTLLLIALVFCVLGLTMGGAELATYRAVATGIAMLLVVVALLQMSLLRKADLFRCVQSHQLPTLPQKLCNG